MRQGRWPEPVTVRQLGPGCRGGSLSLQASRRLPRTQRTPRAPRAPSQPRRLRDAAITEDTSLDNSIGRLDCKQPSFSCHSGRRAKPSPGAFPVEQHSRRAVDATSSHANQPVPRPPHKWLCREYLYSVLLAGGMKHNEAITNTPSKGPFVSTTIPIARPLQTLSKGSEAAIRGSIQSEPDS